jgi:hypothetical protein
MRGLVRSWDDRKQRRLHGRYNGWVRRIRWYEGAAGDGIRLQLEDAEGTANLWYPSGGGAAAQQDWDAFKAGTLTVRQALDRRGGERCSP